MPILLLAVTTTADQLPVGQWAALAVLAFLAWRLVLIVAFPYGPHPRCRGTGKRWNGKYFRPCRGCKGTGRRLRLGRRVWDWVTNNREHAK